MTHRRNDRLLLAGHRGADGCVSIAEIEYLLATGGVDRIMLAGTALVSVDGLRGYLTRHSSHEALTFGCSRAPMAGETPATWGAAGADRFDGRDSAREQPCDAAFLESTRR